MNNLCVFAGVLILLWTYWNYRIEEVELWFLDTWFDLEIHERSFPVLYRAILIFQTLIGIGFLVYGVFLY